MSLTDYIKKVKSRYGYRVGEVAERKAAKVIRFEVEELGNVHILEEAAKRLRVKPTKKAVLAAIRKRFGPEAEAIWLCKPKHKKFCEQYYGHGTAKAHRVDLPAHAALLTDLKEEGQLYVMKKRRRR